MRALVTGAAGFIGSHVVARLVADGHDVVAFDDLSDGDPENVEPASGARFAYGDLRDADAVRSATSGCDVVFHQGAKRSVHRSIAEPALFTDVNVRGTLHVLLAARAEGSRVVNASSSSVYGDQPRFPLVETMLPQPRSPYAASKLAAEAFCRAFTVSMDVPTVSLRYFNVYGPGQDARSEYAVVVPRLAMACLTRARPVIHGDGKQARDFTYIDDVVEANMLAADAGDDAQGLVFNIGGGAHPTSVNELFRLIAELTGSSPQPIFVPPREGDVRRTDADISLARQMLGYAPSVAMREGLGRTIDRLRETLETRGR
jgi:nucleoside-diphosphate-sugar epimerase